MMKSENFPATPRQSVAMDKFLFYFFGLRKGEVKRRVERLRSDYPGESPEELAWRLINADTLTLRDSHPDSRFSTARLAASPPLCAVQRNRRKTCPWPHFVCVEQESFRFSSSDLP